MPKEDKIEKQDLTSDLKKLSGISKWFEDQENIDIEEALKKVKEAAGLIKTSKERLKAVENEFEEIKKEIDLKEDDDSEEEEEEKEEEEDGEEIDAKDIPF